MKADAAEQNSSARKLIVFLAVLITVCLVSLIIGGVTSLISLAERIHPIAGTIVFWSVCLASGFFALYCAIAYARLPPALGPPEEDFGPNYEAYLHALRLRLAANPRTRDKPLETKEEIRAAVLRTYFTMSARPYPQACYSCVFCPAFVPQFTKRENDSEVVRLTPRLRLGRRVISAILSRCKSFTKLQEWSLYRKKQQSRRGVDAEFDSD